ncbi:MAG: hypothetical protein ISS24_01000 [Candidatus Omnitrophica bacterium]|nr:hypothetical protein [Candidatus Omnitrophota bacterium]MBU3933138.1 hypothetical protein [Candidatus Omnitrophota bacterium]
MARISIGRASAILSFLALLAGAGFCLQRLAEDISIGKYFSRPEELHYEIAFLASYLFIIIIVLRYGYYLAVNRVSWETIKGDFLYLLNRKHFTKTQWILNVLLFWLALAGFIYSLVISTMKGNL